MSVNTILIFIHVLGALAYSAALLMSLLGLLILRRTALVEQARPLLGLMEMTGPVSGIGLLLILLAGLYMTFTVYGWQTAWIDIALISVVVLLIPVGAVMGIRRHAIATMVREMPNGPLPESVERRIYDPALGMSTVVLILLLVGVVFLMTTKPLLVGSIVTMVVAAVLGVLLSLPLVRGPAPLESANEPATGDFSRRIEG